MLSRVFLHTRLFVPTVGARAGGACARDASAGGASAGGASTGGAADAPGGAAASVKLALLARAGFSLIVLFMSTHTGRNVNTHMPVCVTWF